MRLSVIESNKWFRRIRITEKIFRDSFKEVKEVRNTLYINTLRRLPLSLHNLEDCLVSVFCIKIPFRVSFVLNQLTGPRPLRYFLPPFPRDLPSVLPRARSRLVNLNWAIQVHCSFCDGTHVISQTSPYTVLYFSRVVVVRSILCRSLLSYFWNLK